MSAMNNKNNEPSTRKPVNKSLPWWQKRAVNISVALLGLVLIIIIMTVNVAKYESHLASGDSVLLELAPVDPRGFMQGDYMTLSYALEREVFAALNAALDSDADGNMRNARHYTSYEGYATVARDKNNVGHFVRLTDSKPDQLAADEMALYYRIRNGSMKIATNAFFFQEGHAEAFEAAEYGLFRVNDKGEPLLTDMVDGKFNIIEGVSIDDAKNLENIERLENRGRQGSGM